MYYIIYRSFNCRSNRGELQKDCIDWSQYSNMSDAKKVSPILKIVEAPDFSWSFCKDDRFTEYFPETSHHDFGVIDYL